MGPDRPSAPQTLLFFLQRLGQIYWHNFPVERTININK